MPHVLIVNPAPRKGQPSGETKMAKAKRSPAQRAATKRMIAANRARSKGSPQKRGPARKVSRAKPRKSPRAVYARSAPRAKKRRSHPITSRAEGTVAGRKLRYRRRNPMGGFITDTLIPSALGGAGALTLDVLLGVLPLPPAWKTGPLAPVVKVAGAIGLGFVAGMVTTKRNAGQIAAGALTVTLYNVARLGLIKISGGKIPGLSEYPDGPMNEYIGEYVEGDDDAQQIGYSSAGMMVGDLQPDGSVEGYETGVYR